MKTANEIIETLYQQKLITFEEAVTLGIQCKEKQNEDDGLTYMLPLAQTVGETEEASALPTADDLIEKYYQQAIEEFDIVMCVNHMHSVDWTWNGEEVTVPMFKKEIRKQIEHVTYQMLDFVKKHKYTVDFLASINDEFYCSGCGFQSCGYFDTNGLFNIEVDFIMESGYAADNQVDDVDIVTIANNR